MKMYQWAKKWNIPESALNELEDIFNLIKTPLIYSAEPKSEAANINIVRLEAAAAGVRLWRNNVGATYTQTGSFLRYGLANDSATINACIKSADLIGIKPVTITPDMVGLKIGQFVSREIKKENWRFSNTLAEQAQVNWTNIINRLGGDACFATGKGTFKT